MTMLLDLIVIAILTVFLTILRAGIKYKKNSWDVAELFSISTDNLIFTSFAYASCLYLGIAMIYFSITGSLFLGSNNIANSSYIVFIAGMVATIYGLALFREIFSFQSEKKILLDVGFSGEEIIKHIDYCYKYTKYQHDTDNPKLDVFRSYKNGLLQVKTEEVENYLTQTILYDLHICETKKIEGEPSQMPSLSLAICKLKSPGKVSVFEILKWQNYKNYKQEIKNIKRNDLKAMKPYLILKPNQQADKYQFEDLETLRKSVERIRNVEVSTNGP